MCAAMDIDGVATWADFLRLTLYMVGLWLAYRLGRAVERFDEWERREQ